MNTLSEKSQAQEAKTLPHSLQNIAKLAGAITPILLAIIGCGGGSPTSPDKGGNTPAKNLSNYYETGDLGGDVDVNKDGTEAKVKANGNDVCYKAGGGTYYLDKTGGISVVIGATEAIREIVRVAGANVPQGTLLAENLYETNADLYKVDACPKGEVLYKDGAPVSPYTEIPETVTPKQPTPEQPTMTFQQCNDAGHCVVTNGTTQRCDIDDDFTYETTDPVIKG